MKNSKRASLILVAVLLLLAMIALVGCGQGSNQNSEGSSSESTNQQQSAEPQKPSEYIVGVAMPLTGSAAALGTDFTESFLMGIEEVNKAGGVDGVPITVISEDTMGTAEGGVNAFNKLVQIKKAPVIATAWSSVVKAMASLAEQNKTLVLNNGANSPELAGISPYQINAFPLSTIDIAVLVDYTYNELGKRKAAILYLNNTTGIGAAELYKERFTELGGEIVAYESVEPEAVDVSTQISKIKAANPDVIHMQLLTGEMAVAYKKIGEMGIKTQITTYSAGQEINVREAGRGAVNGTIYTTMSGGNQAAIDEFAAKFEQEKGHKPNGLAYCVYDYDTAFLLKDAISYLNEKGWEYNGTNLRNAILEKKTFDLPLTGRMVFDAEGTISKTVNINKVIDFADTSKDELVTTIEP